MVWLKVGLAIGTKEWGRLKAAFASRPIGACSAARDMSERVLGALAEAGFQPDDAIRAYRTLVRHTRGFTLAEVASAEVRSRAE